jgi:hypothetical protein
MTAGFLIVQFVYWVALATWFGGVLFVTIAAPIIFRTVRESDPTLPTVLSVNLEGQHGTLLAGSIVANLLISLMRIELICATALGLSIIAHWRLLYAVQLMPMIVRSVLFLLAVGLLIYDWRVISPRVFKHRQEYIDNADEPEIANPAKDQFDRLHRQSVMVLMVQLFALLGLVMFSAGISQTQQFNFSLGSP